ncbi:MAG: sulfur carrier protein ThiS [Candidatus Cloacimonetes bacterium]|nr:sulfur carrier protein ThiS [Candidatus Cloacimonadota bacterium]
MIHKITLNNNPFEWKEYLTITEILKIKNYTFRMLIVKINGTLIKKDMYDKTIVPNGADVKIIHLISGG